MSVSFTLLTSTPNPMLTCTYVKNKLGSLQKQYTYIVDNGRPVLASKFPNQALFNEHAQPHQKITRSSAVAGKSCNALHR